MTATSDQLLPAALNLVRRLPPALITNTLAGLLELQPDLTDELLTTVDQPLKLLSDPKAGQDYILCDYNRDGDSYRSPFTSVYYTTSSTAAAPDINTDGFQPSPQLRALEVEANKLLDIYRRQYFESGYSSAYFFETGEEELEEGSALKSFGAAWLIHKPVENTGAATQPPPQPTTTPPAASDGTSQQHQPAPTAQLQSGTWDSIHVFEVNAVDVKRQVYTYKLTTTIMIRMKLHEQSSIGNVNLSGTMSQQQEQRNVQLNESSGDTHLTVMGSLMEEMELKLRNSIEGIYIQKTREVINGMRYVNAHGLAQFDGMKNSLIEAAAAKGASKTINAATL